MGLTYDRFPIRDNIKKRIESPNEIISKIKFQRNMRIIATFTGLFARVFSNLWDPRSTQLAFQKVESWYQSEPYPRYRSYAYQQRTSVEEYRENRTADR